MERRSKSGGKGRGFTILEVLIVLAIIAAMAGIVAVNLFSQKEGADVDVQKVQLKQICNGIDLFRMDLKRYPTEEEGLQVLMNKTVIADETEQGLWQGPYLKEAKYKDNWNRDLIYRFPGELNGEQAYDLVSKGPDGEEGTADDVTNKAEGMGEDAAARDAPLPMPDSTGGG